MDKIIVKGLEVFSYQGVNPEEKENGQRFVLDIVAHIDLLKPCATDDVDDTVSYAKIIKLASRVMLEKKDDLIESAAQRVADAILCEWDKIESVDITLKKPDAPIKAQFDYVAVEITRSRE